MIEKIFQCLYDLIKVQHASWQETQLSFEKKYALFLNIGKNCQIDKKYVHG